MKSNPTLGKNTPRYSFILNPYDEYRASKCPSCQKQTYPRKFPLLILVKDTYPIALGLTCKYCSRCELIIAHQNELETELCIAFTSLDPESIGHEYFVVGTIDRKKWKGNIGKSIEFQSILEYTYQFKELLNLQFSPGGWRPD
ncbi:MAG TPA: hypothetical protein VM123_13450 [archaeon]|nr:hypothetical protein [archaeon]